MKELIYAVLDLLMEGAVYVALVWLVLSLVSLYMMGTGIIRRPASRAIPVALLVLALGYALANVAVFLSTISVDSFAIFEVRYVVACSAAAPLLGAIPLLLLWWRYGSPGARSAGGYALWIGCVAFAHLAVIAVVSAGV